jgi:tRNA threonylcarbamoyladenosine biosynthesis protein TsaE
MTPAPPVRETLVTASSEETLEFGRRLAARLQPPLLLFLYGELGAGKTTLAKGIISGLGAAREEDVTSPTFTLVHEFRAPAPAHPSQSSPEHLLGRRSPQQPGEGGPLTRPIRVFHIDLYRIEGAAAFDSLGLDDLFAAPAIVLVEWPEKWTLRSDWPVLHIRLAAQEDGRHSIEISTDLG